MTESLRIPHPVSRFRVGRKREGGYLFLCIAANVSLWIVALAYLNLKEPTYTSDWTVTLPGSESRTNVNLPGLGETSTQITSPYSSDSQDPRENYKFIAESETVRSAAAAQLGVPSTEFGKPMVEIIDNTTLMTFKMDGAEPKEAQKKSLALYQAFEARLRELRLQEAVTQNKNLEEALKTAQQKVEESQQSLSEFKARSGLSSNEQIIHLSSNIEQLRRERAEILAQQSHSNMRLRQLSANLNLSPQQATEAFNLQTDPYFQKTLSDYGESSAALADLSSRYTLNHPTFVDQKAKRDFAQTALEARSRALIGKPVTLKYVEKLGLNNSPSRQQLFQELVSIQAKKTGLQAQADEINKQIALLEGRIGKLAQFQSGVDSLERDVQIAETVFSSTLANLDLGKSYNSGSYPPVQLVTEISLPESPSSPNKTFVLLGAMLGSLFLTTGLVTLWLNQNQDPLPNQFSVDDPKPMPLSTETL